MSSYIENVKKYVQKLIPKMLKENPNLKISIVAFGDYCDMENKNTANPIFGKAYQVLDLTDNQEELVSFVKGAKNTYGGDSPEFYELVIRKVTNETSWRENSNKSVLLVADDLLHDRFCYQSSSSTFEFPYINWIEEAEKANLLGIKFDTLQIKKSLWYKELSRITGGITLPFSNSSKTSELLEATFLARGGEATKESFETKMTSKEVVNDKEVSAVYSMYKTML